MASSSRKPRPSKMMTQPMKSPGKGTNGSNKTPKNPGK